MFLGGYYFKLFYFNSTSGLSKIVTMTNTIKFTSIITSYKGALMAKPQVTPCSLYKRPTLSKK